MQVATIGEIVIVAAVLVEQEPLWRRRRCQRCLGWLADSTSSISSFLRVGSWQLKTRQDRARRFSSRGTGSGGNGKDILFLHFGRVCLRLRFFFFFPFFAFLLRFHFFVFCVVFSCFLFSSASPLVSRTARQAGRTAKAEPGSMAAPWVLSSR